MGGPSHAPLSPEAVMALLGPWEAGKLDQLAQKVIHQLSRRQAMGLFDEYTHSSLWGEYSHHVQMGSFDGASDHLDDMAKDVCETVAGILPPHEATLFDHLAMACGEEGEAIGLDYLVRRLSEEVARRASRRNLGRYADDYLWYENL